MSKKRFKVFGLGFACLILSIVVLQNTESVETRFLTFTIIMPRAALLFITLATGFALGFSSNWFWRKTKSMQNPESSKNPSRQGLNSI